VSLHADSPALHEQLTQQPGSFDATLRGLANLNAAGIRTYTFTVVCSLNCDRLGDIAAWGRAHASGTLFFPYIPRRANDPLSISDAQSFQQAMHFIIDTSYVFRSALVYATTVQTRLCRAFTQTVTILADGTVTPCPFVSLPLGNVREAPLYDLLSRAADNAMLEAFLLTPVECDACNIRVLCGGGCKATRITALGDPHGKDLHCQNGPFTGPVAWRQLPECLPYLY